MPTRSGSGAPVRADAAGGLCELVGAGHALSYEMGGAEGRGADGGSGVRAGCLGRCLGRCSESRRAATRPRSRCWTPTGAVLAEAVLSQLAEHAPFGGVVPEVAARAHLAHLPGLAGRVMREAGLGFDGARGGGGDHRARADRRPDRRRRLRQGHRARAPAALHRRQSPGSACPDRAPAAHRTISTYNRARVSLSAAAGVGRPLPVRRGGGARAIPAAGSDDRRRGGRGVRQGGEVAWPFLAGRSGPRAPGRRGRSRPPCPAPADARPRRAASSASPA